MYEAVRRKLCRALSPNLMCPNSRVKIPAEFFAPQESEYSFGSACFSSESSDLLRSRWLLLVI